MLKGKNLWQNEALFFVFPPPPSCFDGSLLSVAPTVCAKQAGPILVGAIAQRTSTFAATNFTAAVAAVGTLSYIFLVRPPQIQKDRDEVA